MRKTLRSPVVNIIQWFLMVAYVIIGLYIEISYEFYDFGDSIPRLSSYIK